MKQKRGLILFGIGLLSFAMLAFAMYGCETNGCETAPTPSALTIQAEDAYYNNALIESEYTGYTGSGYVNTTNAAGTYLEWAINATTNDNNASCTITYANGSGASRAMEVSVNGNITLSRLDFPDSGSWDSWNTKVITIPLNAGTNTLRLTSLDSAGAPNLDKIDLASTGSLSTSDTPAPTNPTTVTNATVYIIGDSTV